MLDLSSKTTSALLPTDILFQTRYWAQVKSRLGYTPMAFDLLSSRQCGDVLVLLQPFGRGKAVAYVPQGPEFAPAEEDYGPFLEHVSVKLSRHLGPKVAFIRYDLPWKSQYADEMQDAEMEFVSGAADPRTAHEYGHAILEHQKIVPGYDRGQLAGRRHCRAGGAHSGPHEAENTLQYRTRPPQRRDDTGRVRGQAA